MSRVIKRVLIFRLGSLGDTIVALPAFHLIARAYPSAQRWVLTQTDADPRAASIPQLLAGSELVHDFIRYPLRTRAPSEFLRLRREIRRFRPDVLVYLAEPRGWLKTRRDVLFFRSCGIPRLIGVPYSRKLQRRRQVSTDEFEFEGARLLRCLDGLGDIDIDAAGAFDLGLTEPEKAAASAALAPLPPSSPVLMFSVGAKVDVKDWGDDNWTTLLQRLAPRLHGWSLVALGAGVEHERSARLLAAWSGPSLNLCGVLSVRESGAVLERGRLFIGHDSGPMHLASAVGTTCVVVFSSRDLPGEWFPRGPRHHVLYTEVPCRGCRLDTCSRYAKMCIASVRVEDVLREVEGALSAPSDEPPQPHVHGAAGSKRR